MPVGRVLLLIDAIGASSKCNTISVSVILYFATTTHYVKRNISYFSLHMQTSKQNTKYKYKANVTPSVSVSFFILQQQPTM